MHHCAWSRATSMPQHSKFDIESCSVLVLPSKLHESLDQRHLVSCLTKMLVLDSCHCPLVSSERRGPLPTPVLELSKSCCSNHNKEGLPYRFNNLRVSGGRLLVLNMMDGEPETEVGSREG
jgi:hypothetical protein